jgi:hypothetical protein
VTPHPHSSSPTLPAENDISSYALLVSCRLAENSRQNLRVKTFVGTTANALKTQIWTALIALLAIKFLQLQAKFTWSLSRLIALLRQQLFVHRDLWRWLESPFEPPLPLTEEDSPQLPFAWAQ